MLTGKPKALVVRHRYGNPVGSLFIYNFSQQERDDIAEYFHVSEGTIKHINAGRNYKNSALSYPLKTGRAKGEKEPVSTILAKRSTLTIDT